MCMRDLLAKTKLDHLICQQAQTPFGISFWWRTTGQCSDFCTLLPINLDGSAGARTIIQSLQPIFSILFGQRGQRPNGHLDRFGYSGIGLTTIQFKQGKRTTIGFCPEFAFANQGFEILSICWTELYVLFVHLAIFYQMPAFVKN